MVDHSVKGAWSQDELAAINPGTSKNLVLATGNDGLVVGPLDDVSRVRDSGVLVSEDPRRGPFAQGPIAISGEAGSTRGLIPLGLGMAMPNGPPETYNGAGIITEQPTSANNSRKPMGKKVRKMKKLILAESEGFFEDMESETDRRENDQERISSRRIGRKEKTKRKLKLRTSLESISQIGISHRNVSADSNYFVDCREKRVAEVDCVRQEAEEVWKLGKELGAVSRSEEERVIGELVEMECRDREAVPDSSLVDRENGIVGEQSHSIRYLASMLGG